MGEPAPFCNDPECQGEAHLHCLIEEKVHEALRAHREQDHGSPTESSDYILVRKDDLRLALDFVSTATLDDLYLEMVLDEALRRLRAVARA